MPELPIGDAVEKFTQFLQDHLGEAFDVFANVLMQLVDVVYTVLVAPHPLLLIAVLAVLAWLAGRRVTLVVFTVLAFLLVASMQLWVQTMQTLAVVLVAAVIAVAVGVPLGVWAARSSRVSMVIRPVLDFMQTLPVFVYLIPAVFLFGIGVVPGVVATTAFAVPPAVRLTQLGIRQVDAEVVEAAVAFGSRPWQVLREVQLPLALPSIMAGINQVIMMALSMVVIAGMVGAQGLGSVVVQSVTQLDIGKGFEGGLAVVILAIYLDRLTSAAGSRDLTRRRARRRAAEPDAPAQRDRMHEEVTVPLA
ncbi:ABC transporter permease [Microbispora hainanensis]|uniref:ABC transporter permease subunit n=1 Tax=Microbispora hainanensis TaxID=568844 RepID=A0A544YYN5_9ACTN|nr:ABC transporter permease subunit [Microbispora hainanensis]TQS21894.1 ABC transporter permease subunit [Microbispora hainanensis]